MKVSSYCFVEGRQKGSEVHGGPVGKLLLVFQTGGPRGAAKKGVVGMETNVTLLGQTPSQAWLILSAAEDTCLGHLRY